MLNNNQIQNKGVPYPPSKDPRIVNKQTYLNRIWNDKQIKGDKLDGRKWYLQQAIRAMNQAIGRVIRHKDDWGAVYLCDSRFNNLDVKNEISDWVKVDNGLKDFNNFPTALIQTKKFFDMKKQTGSNCNPKKKLQIQNKTSIQEVKNNIISKQQDAQSSQLSQKIKLKGKQSQNENQLEKQQIQDNQQNNKKRTSNQNQQMSIQSFLQPKSIIEKEQQSKNEKRKELSSSNIQKENNENQQIQGNIQLKMEIQNENELTDEQKQFLEDTKRQQNQQTYNASNQQFLKSKQTNNLENNNFNNELQTFGSNRKVNPQTNISNFRSQKLNSLIKNPKLDQMSEENQNYQDKIFAKGKTENYQQTKNYQNEQFDQNQMQNILFQKQDEPYQIRQNQYQQINYSYQDNQNEVSKSESYQNSFLDNRLKLNQQNIYETSNDNNINNNNVKKDQKPKNSLLNREIFYKDNSIDDDFSKSNNYSLNTKNNFQIKEASNESSYNPSNYERHQLQKPSAQVEEFISIDSLGQFKNDDMHKFQHRSNLRRTFQPQNKLGAPARYSSSSDRQYSNNSMQENQRCIICKDILTNPHQNQNCKHVGCYSCYLLQIQKERSCICQKQCSLKDLKKI